MGQYQCFFVHFLEGFTVLKSPAINHQMFAVSLILNLNYYKCELHVIIMEPYITFIPILREMSYFYCICIKSSYFLNCEYQVSTQKEKNWKCEKFEKKQLTSW